MTVTTPGAPGVGRAVVSVLGATPGVLGAALVAGRWGCASAEQSRFSCIFLVVPSTFWLATTHWA
jgi:hypothetical protein